MEGIIIIKNPAGKFFVKESRDPKFMLQAYEKVPGTAPDRLNKSIKKYGLKNHKIQILYCPAFALNTLVRLAVIEFNADGRAGLNGDDKIANKASWRKTLRDRINELAGDKTLLVSLSYLKETM